MVDARGYLCPMPVVMVQNAIKKDNPAALEVLVDVGNKVFYLIPFCCRD